MRSGEKGGFACAIGDAWCQKCSKYKSKCLLMLASVTKILDKIRGLNESHGF